MSSLELAFFNNGLHMNLVHHLMIPKSFDSLRSYFRFAAVCHTSSLLLGGRATCASVLRDVEAIRFDFLMQISSPHNALGVLRACLEMNRPQQLCHADILACKLVIVSTCGMWDGNFQVPLRDVTPTVEGGFGYKVSIPQSVLRSRVTRLASVLLLHKSKRMVARLCDLQERGTFIRFATWVQVSYGSNNELEFRVRFNEESCYLEFEAVPHWVAPVLSRRGMMSIISNMPTRFLHF